MSAALPLPPDAVRARLAQCRAILGADADPMAAEWHRMKPAERAFWLGAARQAANYAAREWPRIPAEARCALKNTLYRAARRAHVILSAVGAPEQ